MIRIIPRFWERFRLATRVMLAASISIILAAGAALYLTVENAADHTREDLAEEYKRELSSLVIAVSPSLASENQVALRNTLEGIQHAPSVVRIGFRDASESVEFDHETLPTLTAPAWFASWCHLSDIGGTRPLTLNGRYYGLISLYLTPIPAINRAWDRAEDQLTVLLLALGLVLASIWVVLGLGLRPLRNLVDASQALGQGDFAARVPERGSPDIRIAIAGFNQMANSVEQMVRQVREREEHLRVTLRSIGDGVIATDGEGRVRMMNPVAEALTGWREDEARTRHLDEIFQIINEDSRATVESPVTLVLREGNVVGMANHTLLIAKDGRETPIADSGAPIRLGASVDIDGVVLVFRDQSDERDHLRAVEESERQYASLAQASPVGIFRTNNQDRVIYANERLFDLIGTTPPSDLPGEDWLAAFIHPQDKEAAVAAWFRKPDAAWHFRVLRPDGAIRWLAARCAPVQDGEGRPLGHVGTLTDVTAERDNQREIENLSRLYATLSQVNHAIVRAQGQDALFQTVCEVAVETGGFVGAWFVLADWEKSSATLAASAGISRDQFQAYGFIDGVDLRANSPHQQALSFQILQHGKRIVINDFRAEILGPRLAAAMESFDAGALVGVPIRSEGQTVAALMLAAKDVGFFSEDRLALADEIGMDVSYALERFEQEERERLAMAMFDNSREGIFITTAPDNSIVMANRAFAELTGYDSREVMGHPPKILSSGHHDKHFYQNLWYALQHEGHWQGEITDRRKNGEFFPAMIGISAVHDREGRCTHYVAQFSDISKQKEIEARISHLAYRDALTDLPNRALLEDRLEQNLVSARREESEVALLFIDLDNFKTINDSLGHAVGDSLLRELAQRLRAAVRDMDTVGRLGGDEFMVVLPGCDQEAAAHVAQKLLQEIARPFDAQNHTLAVTTSIGIAIFPKDGTNYNDLLKTADTAMYRAKSEGRNAYRFFTPEMNQAVFQRLMLESSLRRAIDANEFILFYQPQHRIDNRQLVGMEALIRWRRPEGGFVSPGQFIAIAEDSGLIEPIGAWVLGETCRQIRAWQAAGLATVRVAVNLSTRQFAARNLLDVVDWALNHSDLPGECLEVEITESLLAGDMDYVLEVLHAFKQRGITVSIDDFGTGYSSLSYLKRFPIDSLKIDQSFVRDLVVDADDRAIATAIVTLGHSLGMKVIAEGVEQEEQLAILREMGCDEVQGYLLGHPQPAEEITRLLKECTPS